jgi:hypothetical protein
MKAPLNPDELGLLVEVLHWWESNEPARAEQVLSRVLKLLCEGKG